MSQQQLLYQLYLQKLKQQQQNNNNNNNYVSKFNQKNTGNYFKGLSGALKDNSALLNPVLLLGSMAIKGGHRKAAQQQAQQALQNAQQNTAQTAAENTAQQQANNAIINNGQITGAAAPVQNTVMKEYQDYLKNNGYPDDVVNGVAQGLNSGYNEIDDWLKQYNANYGATNNNYYYNYNADNNLDDINPADESLYNAVDNNNIILQPPSEDKYPVNNKEVDNTKKGILSKFAQGIGDLMQGYQENRTNSFSPENLTNNKFDDNTDKGGMARAGEALGTLSRIASNPNVQGIAAGTIGTALTGNPLYGVGLGYKTANQKQLSNIYQNVLKDFGINADTGIAGTLDDSAVNNITNPYLQQMKNDTELLKLQNDIENKNRNYELDKQKMLLQIDQKEQELQYKYDSLAETRRNNDLKAEELKRNHQATEEIRKQLNDLQKYRIQVQNDQFNANMDYKNAALGEAKRHNSAQEAYQRQANAIRQQSNAIRANSNTKKNSNSAEKEDKKITAQHKANAKALNLTAVRSRKDGRIIYVADDDLEEAIRKGYDVL